jgi:hypothetical protein
VRLLYPEIMADISRKKRTLQLDRSPRLDGVGVFHFTEKEASTYYAFREIPCDIGGRGFAVHRLGLGNLYHVRIGKPEECSCECLGFLAHGRCKHLQALLSLERRGKL